MLNSTFKKYFPFGFVCLLVNILIFIFWWVVTDPGNYIWKAIVETNAQSIISACNKLFFIHYYISLVVINCVLAALFLIDTKRLIAISIIVFAGIFYIGMHFIFNPYIGKNYFVLFENQNVSKGFYLEPVLDAGKSICPYLLEKLNDKPSFTREQAARGLGIHEYTPATTKLNGILSDSTESVNMRAETYYALKKINTIESKQLLEAFAILQESKSDDALVERIDYLEMQDVY